MFPEFTSVEQYGESLLCVRYRYDETRGIRLKTVEIIFLTSVFALKAATAHADVVWPALYVADSHFRFWYVVIIGKTEGTYLKS